MKYDVAMIDPPWPKKKGGLRKVAPNQTRELNYQTVDLNGIGALLDTNILPLLHPQHTVFLWTVDQFLHDAEQMFIQRGYRLHARCVWNKRNGVAPAFSVRYTHEYLLWLYKGKFMPVAKSARGKLPTIIEGKQREHSRKPDEAYSFVDTLFPVESKIDVFSREKRHGWAQWGNQTAHFKGPA